jgi:glutamate N-acetyltransferase/amino-acid N-acetyltransferase
MAAGNAGVKFDLSTVNLFMGDAENLVQVLEKGAPKEFDKSQVKKLLRESHLRVLMEMNQGKAEALGWGSDITTDYVMFNSVYTT